MAPTVVLVTDRFQAFSAEHFGLLAFFLLVCVALVVAGRRRRGDDTVFRRGFAIVLACVVVPIQVVQLRPWDFDLQSSLPINLCDLAWLCAVYALWTRRPWAVALTYYWGLTLTIQGILTPSLGQQFPDPRYFGFWGLHFLTVWSAVYLVSSGNPPTWRGYRFTVLVTAVWASVTMFFNAVAGTNYGYLNRKPDSASLLDLLPGWPAYVVLEILDRVRRLGADDVAVRPHQIAGGRRHRLVRRAVPSLDARDLLHDRAVTRPTVTGGYLERPAPSGLADVIEIILDKGIVIDAYVRVSVVGIELLTIDARIVIASVDTYLRFAEATNRLDLWPEGGKGLPEIVEELQGPVIEKVASKVAEKKVGKVAEKAEDKVANVAEKAHDAADKVKDVVTPGGG